MSDDDWQQRMARREAIERRWCDAISGYERDALGVEYGRLRAISPSNARRRLNRQAKEWRSAQRDGLIR